MLHNISDSNWLSVFLAVVLTESWNVNWLIEAAELDENLALLPYAEMLS